MIAPRPGWSARCLAGAAFLALTLGLASPAEAGLISGIQKIVGGIFQLPLSTLVGTFTGPPLLGTAMGAVNGLVSGTGMVLGGALEVTGAGVSLAKMVAPYVLPFVF
ncbi:MAG: hypothetical protein HYT90_02365 [Candidatus Omnitrophica bacterium]|nr:hypothetical protein [Candidatus Omnitrophota bacterium]